MAADANTQKRRRDARMVTTSPRRLNLHYKCKPLKKSNELRRIKMLFNSKQKQKNRRGETPE